MDDSPKDQHTDDQVLMRRYLEGDDMAFRSLYRRYRSQVYSYLKRRIADPETVNELFQQSFLKFHRNRHRYHPKYPLLKWLYVITRSVLLDHYKGSSKHATSLSFDDEIAAPELDPSIAIEAKEILQDESLSERERQAIAQRYLSEEEYHAIAKQLCITESNARQLISRALKKLKQRHQG